MINKIYLHCADTIIRDAELATGIHYVVKGARHSHSLDKAKRILENAHCYGWKWGEVFRLLAQDKDLELLDSNAASDLERALDVNALPSEYEGDDSPVSEACACLNDPAVQYVCAGNVSHYPATAADVWVLLEVMRFARNLLPAHYLTMIGHSYQDALIGDMVVRLKTTGCLDDCRVLVDDRIVLHVKPHGMGLGYFMLEYDSVQDIHEHYVNLLRCFSHASAGDTPHTRVKKALPG